MKIFLHKILTYILIFLNVLFLTSCQTKNNINDIPSFKIARTSFLGSVWNKGHAKTFVISQDGGNSIIIPDGFLWWFGDTFIGSRKEDGKPDFEGTAVSCSMAYLRKGDLNLPPKLEYLT